MTAHIPVLTDAAMQYLQPERGGLFVDCTVGLGGHAKALLERGATRVIGLDRDTDALAAARITLARWTLIVISLVPSSAAICLFSSPETTRGKTSRSRGVSKSNRSRSTAISASRSRRARSLSSAD